MKIAMISFNIIGRGTYQRAYFLASELAKKGHQVTLLAANSAGSAIEEIDSDSVKIVTFPRLLQNHYLSGWGFYEAERRIAWIKDRSFDIVHSFENRPTCIYPSLQATKNGAILISDWADWLGKGGSVEERPNIILRTLLRPFETFYENHFKPYSSGITVICQELFKKSRQLGIDNQKILYLPNGFNNPLLTSYDIKNARSSLNLSHKDFIIGYIGAGFRSDMDLMSASYQVLKEHIPNLKLIHIGRTKYHLEGMSDVIRTNEVDNKQMSLYLSACNLFWLPFKNTNANAGRFPLKFSDYLTIGRPIVSTSVGDIQAFNDKYKFGLIADDNPKDISDSVLTIYSNPIIQKDMGENAMMLSKSTQEDWAARAFTLEKFYEFLISR